MESIKIEQLRKMVSEVLAEGFGEVDLKIIIKNSKVELVSLTKVVTSKIDLNKEKVYS